MCIIFIVLFFFKQKTAYEMRISDWSSDVCSSDLVPVGDGEIDFNLNYTYSSKSYQEFDEYLFVPELSLVNAQMSWQINDMYKVSLWGRNLTNKFYYYNMSAVNLASTGSAADPRTYGVNFEVRFCSQIFLRSDWYRSEEHTS